MVNATLACEKGYPRGRRSRNRRGSPIGAAFCFEGKYEAAAQVELLDCGHQEAQGL